MNQSATQPVPQGAYRPAARHGDLIFSSGMTPRRGGVLIHTGRMRAADPVEAHQDAVVLATLNALTAAQGCLAEGERIAVVLLLTVFQNTEPEFSAHSKVADFASATLIAQLGPDCIGSRAAIGVASLRRKHRWRSRSWRVSCGDQHPHRDRPALILTTLAQWQAARAGMQARSGN